MGSYLEIISLGEISVLNELQQQFINTSDFNCTSLIYLFFYFYFFVFLLFLWAAPAAYGGSQARG